MSGGHLRLLAAARVAASGRGKCRKVSVGGCQAATCGHSSGCKWLQMAAGDKRLLAATCGHLRPLEWLQVAAISKITLRASLRAQCVFVIPRLLQEHFFLWESMKSFPAGDPIGSIQLHPE